MPLPSIVLPANPASTPLSPAALRPLPSQEDRASPVLVWEGLLTSPAGAGAGMGMTCGVRADAAPPLRPWDRPTVADDVQDETLSWGGPAEESPVRPQNPEATASGEVSQAATLPDASSSPSPPPPPRAPAS